MGSSIDFIFVSTLHLNTCLSSAAGVATSAVDIVVAGYRKDECAERVSSL